MKEVIGHLSTELDKAELSIKALRGDAAAARRRAEHLEKEAEIVEARVKELHEAITLLKNGKAMAVVVTKE